MLKVGQAIREKAAREAAWLKNDARITDLFASHSTEALKKLWDDYPTVSDLDFEFDIDDIHRALVMRGEADYVRI
jgi:hypothetical protein